MRRTEELQDVAEAIRREFVEGTASFDFTMVGLRAQLEQAEAAGATGVITRLQSLMIALLEANNAWQQSIKDRQIALIAEMKETLAVLTGGAG